MKPLLRPALLLAGLIVAGLALRMLPQNGASALLQSFADPGAHGWAPALGLYICAAAAFCAIGVPRQIVAYAAGFAFGTVAGTLAGLAATLLACAADFWWARLVARGWAQAFMSRRLGGRVARLDRFLAANPFAATIMLRLLPVGSNLLLNLLAGVSRIAAVPFIAASAIGYVPQTFILALIGSGARVARPTQIGVGIALFAVAALAGVVLMRRLRVKDGGPEDGVPVPEEASPNAGAPDARCAAIPPA